jgi:hypothetical protein
MPAMPPDLEAAWDDLHDAKPPGWFVGRPSYDEGRREWVRMQPAQFPCLPG